MPVSLKTPQQWACSQYDWRQAVVNKSDVLLPKPEKCPKCGSEIELKARQWPTVSLLYLNYK